MATSSIFHSVHITEEASCQSLLDAIDSSRKAKEERPELPNNIKVANRKEDIARLFKRR
jgi:hypothetical protein